MNIDKQSAKRLSKRLDKMYWDIREGFETQDSESVQPEPEVEAFFWNVQIKIQRLLTEYNETVAIDK